MEDQLEMLTKGYRLWNWCVLVVAPLVFAWALVLGVLTVLNTQVGTARAGAFWPGRATAFAFGDDVWQKVREDTYFEDARSALIRAGLVDPDAVDAWSTKYSSAEAMLGVLGKGQTSPQVAIPTVELADPPAVIEVSWNTVATANELLRVAVGPSGEGDRVALVIARGRLSESRVVPTSVRASVEYRIGGSGSAWTATGDAVRFAHRAPLDQLGFPTGLETTTLDMDEEALAAWFVDVLRRYGRNAQAAVSTVPSIQSAFTPIELADESAGRLTRGIAELVKFRFGGALGTSGNGIAGGIAEPLEMASSLRWVLWINGTDPLASWMLFAIYYLSAVASGHLALRYVINFRGRGLSLPNLYERITSCIGRPQESVELAQDYWDGRRWFVLNIELMIPAVGFIGTIVGLGSAFGSVGIISQIEVIQRQSLMGVLLDLGTAFSTTFWALILSGLVIVPLNAFVCSYEERKLIRKVAGKGL